MFFESYIIFFFYSILLLILFTDVNLLFWYFVWTKYRKITGGYKFRLRYCLVSYFINGETVPPPDPNRLKF